MIYNFNADTSICPASVISTVAAQGAEQALRVYPELLQLQPLLEEIAQASDTLALHQRLADSYSTRLDELGAELADRVENGS